MQHLVTVSMLVLAAALLPAQETQEVSPSESRYDVQYAVGVIDDATLYSNLSQPIPGYLNQTLVEPRVTLRYNNRWAVSTSLIGMTATSGDMHAKLHVREAYAGLSAGDFDFMAGRKMVRWGAGYAFTAAGVLDPPRVATDPSDRLNVHEGRDMVKADWVRGPHAISMAWSTAALAPKAANALDTTAFRYNVLVHGFDTSLIAGDDRGGDAFGAMTFTRVFGQAWEVHGEAAWREQAAVLVGGKFVTHSGMTFIGEFFTPPNIPYYRDMSISAFAGRQHYGFFDVSKSRLRELPGWKEWDLDGYVVANLDDHSYTAAFDANRRFGNHFSSYVHMEIPRGAKTSDYGSAPYSTATSVGVRFQL